MTSTSRKGRRSPRWLARLRHALLPHQGHHAIKMWRPLRLFSLYRLVLASLFILLFLSDGLPQPPGLGNATLFFRFSLVYLVMSLLTLAGTLQQRPPFLVQLYAQLVTDIVFITLLMHVSGGFSGGIGMLLVISVAIGSMIAPGRSAAFFASLATIALLLEQGYASLIGLPEGYVSYPQAGILGAALFTSAIVANVLGRRVRESEALAEQRSVDLANMEQLADYVIQQMQTGVIVVDNQKRVRLMNSAAFELLGIDLELRGHVTLEMLSQDLHKSLVAWQQGVIENPQLQPLQDITQQVLPRFKAIGPRHNGGAMIFLDESSRTTHQAQQLKLASLGRLTAGIAHEVRNPLGAISHAGELLGESEHLDAKEQRLAQIIVDQSRRMNTIIENVLQLGRRDRAQPITLLLAEWLPRFIHDFALSAQHPAEAFEWRVEPEGLQIEFDTGHLQQILWNLCQNGIRHSGEGPNPRLELLAGITVTGRPYLDIVDQGPGITEDNLGNIFEPFFTTESRGTGLGLYIARELAESNRAQLRYQRRDGKSCFRLSFSQPEVSNVKS